MRYIVQVEIVCNAATSAAARDKVRAACKKHKIKIADGSPNAVYVDERKADSPRPSKTMKRFLRAAIEDNEYDPSGDMTNLGYCESILWEEVGVAHEAKMSGMALGMKKRLTPERAEAVVNVLKQEIAVLIKYYGNGYFAGDFL